MMSAQSKAKSLELNMPIVAGDVRPINSTQLRRAKASLAARVANLTEASWKVQIEFGDGEVLFVDCKAGTVTPAGTPPADLDCALKMAPGDLQQLMTGSDPRSFIMYQRLEVVGSIVAAVKFCDLLGDRRTINVLHIDAPLPQPTSDYELARAQLDEFGYCYIKEALTPEQVRQLRTRLIEQAAAEAALGYANRATGQKGIPDIQPVWNLINKGQVFLELLEHPLIDEIILDNLGEHFLLSSYTSKIAGPGCKAQIIHYDQMGIRPPLYEVNVGLNLFFFLDDFTDANGGTRLIPGSHRSDVRFGVDNTLSTEGTIAAEAPAGTALIFDSRLWHATESNRTTKARHAVFMYFVRSWMRTAENSTLSVRPAVLEKMSRRVKIMHGFRCTRSSGGVEGPVEGEMVRRDFEGTVPELHLADSNR